MSTISCTVTIGEEEVEELKNLALEDTLTPQDLQALVNSAEENSDEQQNYDFYIGTTMITETIEDTLALLEISEENNVHITALPTSTMTVAALSRCSADLAGHEDSILCLQFAPDSKNLASGSGDKTVRIWDINTATCRYVLDCFEDWVLVLRYSPNGRFLAVADHHGSLYLFEAATYELVQQNRQYKPAKNKWITSIVWSYDSKFFFTGGKDGMVREYDANGVERRAVCQLSKCVTDVTIGSRHLIVSSEDCKVYLFDLQSLAHEQVIRHAHWVNSVETSLGYYVRFGVQALLRNFDVVKRELSKLRPGLTQRQQLESLSETDEEALLHDFLCSRPEFIVTSSDDHTMQLFAITPEFRMVATLTGHVKVVSHAIFSPDGMNIASCGFDRSVRLFDTSGRFIEKFYNHVSEVYKLAFSSDSRYLLSCSKDSTCKLYSIKKRKMIRDLPGHFDEVYCVDWSLQGDIGASAGKDKMVKLWRQ